MKPRWFLVLSGPGFVTAFLGNDPCRRPRNSHGRPLGLSDLGDDPAAPLTNALARLDQQWKLTQRSKTRSRWTQISLQDDDPGSGPDPASDPSSPGDVVYLLEPPNQSLPSCLIVFVGGAGLGEYPQVAYGELLLRVSDRLNAAVVAAPYRVGLDHFGLAQRVGELARRAAIRCEDDPRWLYPAALPTYCLGHSLGCKLMAIYLGATGQEFDGIGFMSFNNFAFAQTIGMAKQFAGAISGATQMASDSMTSIMNQALDLVSGAVAALGVEFTPTPLDTERLIRLRFDAARQQRTRLFVFDDDTLDSSQSFIDACAGPGPTVSGLPGTHLTPVFFKFGLDSLPEETRDFAREATRGFESASFGNESELEALVEELVGWIKGAAPSRPARAAADRPKLIESIDD